MKWDSIIRYGIVRRLEPFEFNEPSVTVIANVSAAPYTRDNIKKNLVNQITSPVRWFESIQYLRQNGETEFIEVDPGNVLSRLLPQI